MWQIWILLWKHAKARIRNYKRLLTELLFPATMFALVFSIRHNISTSRSMETAHYTEAVNQEYLFEYSNVRNIYYSSNYSDFTNALMKEVAEKLNVDSVTGYHSKNDLMGFNEQNLKKHKSNLAVIFKDDNNSIPENLQYSIHSSEKYEIFKTGPRIKTAGPHENYGRIYEKFASLQIAIDSAFIEMKSKNASLKKIHVQSFPYPPYIRNEGCNMKYNIVLPFLIINSYFVLIVSIMDDLLSEQKSGIKELMIMMGLKRYNYWIAHFLNNIIVQFVVALIYVFFLKITIDALIPNTDGFILLLTFVSQSIYVILFTFMICSFFSEVCLAALVGFTMWILSQVLRDPCSNETSIFHFVLPNVAISKMMNIIGYYEIQGDGLQFENLCTKSERFPESYIQILMIQLIISLIFVIVFSFMESFNSRSYWERTSWMLKNLKSRKTHLSPPLLKDTIEMNHTYFEASPPDADFGIKIKGVSKIYMSWGGYVKKALSDVSINIPKSGITALLGHNGAGKTTLMSIITGMQSATDGIIDYHKSFTKHIGICPQENIVIEQLTVKENVIFFGMIKGLSKKEAKEESYTILKKLDLSNKKNSLGKDLSGGGQRRLQLALAISGNSSILVLDEPTSGLDAKVKREVWDKLLSLRGSHTILITTHLMEEAEILGDRIAILNHGQIKCYGTPNFIKETTCPHYKLKVLTDQMNKNSSVKNYICEFFPISRVEDESDNLIQFVLKADCKKTIYNSMDRLKKGKKSLGIESFSLLEPTMEEGYLSICHGKLEHKDDEVKNECIEEYSTNRSCLTIVRAFMTNRFIFIKRRFYMFFPQIIFALLLFLFAALYKVDITQNHNEDPMKIDLSIYNQSDVQILYSSFTNDSSLERWIKMKKVPFEYISGDMEKTILDRGTEDISSFSKNLLVAMTFADVYTGFYSTSVYHTLPVVINMLTNKIASEVLGFKPTPYFTVFNSPIDIDAIPDKSRTQHYMFIWGIVVSFGWNIFMSIYLPYVTIENVSGSRKLQFMTGINKWLYWGVIVLMDFIFCLIMMGIFAIIIINFDSFDTFTIEVLGPICVLILSSTIVIQAFIYLISNMFQRLVTGVLLLMFLNITSCIFSFALYLEKIVRQEGYFLSTAQYIFKMIPLTNLSLGFFNILQVSSERNSCIQSEAFLNRTEESQYCCGKDDQTEKCQGLLNYYDDKNFGLLNNLEYQFYCLLWILAWNFVTSRWDIYQKRNNSSKQNFPVSDPRQTLQSKDLSKTYKKWFNFKKSNEPKALDGVNFNVNEGDCFGILGLNGAGKTTTFKIITGTEYPSDGNVIISGKTKDIPYSVSYCPQFDSICGYMTATEVLHLFGTLRGMPEEKLKEEVKDVIKRAGLEKVANIPNEHYSGGNKRKLSLAVALIGLNSSKVKIVLLDEPTAGVDPYSRKLLHSMIKKAKGDTKSIILSSHNMNECELLCNQLGVMLNGKMKEVNNPQKIKDIFGMGVALKIKLKPYELSDDDEADGESSKNEEIDENRPKTTRSLIADIHESFKEHPKKSFNESYLEYNLDKEIISYSDLFNEMEKKMKENPLIEYYTICESSMEEAFLDYIQKNNGIKNSCTIQIV